MKSWKELKTELESKFKREYWSYYNDKNKYTRRIKIRGKAKYQIQKYLTKKYPGLVTWETEGGYYNGFYTGICFNLPH